MSTELTPSKRRSILIATLRDKRLWPSGFSWNFQTCTTCAIGLFEQMFSREEVCNEYRGMEKMLALPEMDFNETFCLAFSSKTYGTTDYKKITPAMVADHLETVHKRLPD